MALTFKTLPDFHTNFNIDENYSGSITFTFKIEISFKNFAACGTFKIILECFSLRLQDVKTACGEVFVRTRVVQTVPTMCVKRAMEIAPTVVKIVNLTEFSVTKIAMVTVSTTCAIEMVTVVKVVKSVTMAICVSRPAQR